MGFKLKSSASKEAAKKQKERGGSMRSYKLGDKKQARLLILPPTDDKESVFGVNQEHKHFGPDQKPIVTVASPFAFGDKDKWAIIGFQLKKKYAEDDNEKKKDLWKLFLPKKEYVVNVLDIDDLDAGVQQFVLPGSAVETVLDELEDVGDDLTSICDFDEGRPLIIKSNQLPKLKRRYKVKFASEPAQLDLSDEEKEAIEKSIMALSKVQKKFKEEDYNKLGEFLTKKAKALGIDVKKMFEKIEDEDGEPEEEEELEEDNDVTSDIEDFEDDDDEKSSKKSSKSSKSSKKSSKKDEDEEEEETEIEEFEEEEEEDEKPSKSSKKSSNKKEEKSSKKSSKKDDDDEFEDENSEDENGFDDDDDDFEEEEEKPKKSSSKKSRR